MVDQSRAGSNYNQMKNPGKFEEILDNHVTDYGTPAECKISVDGTEVKADIHTVRLDQFVDAHHILTVHIRHVGVSSDSVEFDDPSMQFYSNVTAGPLMNPEDIKEKLKEQVTHPVRWEELIRNMIADGITQFVEVGAGRVLSGLVRKIDRNVSVHNVSDSGTFSSFLQSLSGTEEEND